MVNQNYPQKATKANHIDVEFSGHRLTNYGGLSVFSEFLFDKLDFSQHVEQHLHLGMGSNCSYKNEQVLGLVVFVFCVDTSASPILSISAKTCLPSSCWD